MLIFNRKTYHSKTIAPCNTLYVFKCIGEIILNPIAVIASSEWLLKYIS